MVLFPLYFRVQIISYNGTLFQRKEKTKNGRRKEGRFNRRTEEDN